MRAEMYGFRSPLGPRRAPLNSRLPEARPLGDVWLLPGWELQIAPWRFTKDRARARLVGLFCVMLTLTLPQGTLCLPGKEPLTLAFIAQYTEPLVLATD